MTDRRRRFTSWVICVAAASALLRAQTAGEATFHAGTREVLVDAVVVDKKGNFQSGLTAQNFKLFEDGKEQKITSFSIESALNPEHTKKHFIALVFETQPPGLGEEVARFVDRFASTNLYLAVYARAGAGVKLLQGFTTDGAKIKAAVDQMRLIAPPPLGIGGARRIPFVDGVTSAAKEMAPVRGRKVAVLFSGSAHGSVSYFGGTRSPGAGEEGKPGPAIPTIAEYMRKAIDEINSANVSVYAFRTGKDAGISVGSYYDPPKGVNQYSAATDFVRDLAIGTGGKYTAQGEYDLASYLTSVSREQDDYYVLGYVPRPVRRTNPATS